jgi:hypothetical protein
MGVFVLTETSAGYALFKAKDKSIIKSGGNVEDVVGALKLKQFLVSIALNLMRQSKLTTPRNSRMPSLLSTKPPPSPTPRFRPSSASF